MIYPPKEYTFFKIIPPFLPTVHCYAKKDHAIAWRNYLTCDVHSPLLLGHMLLTDTVKPLKQESFLSKELSLFDIDCPMKA